ncbi:MAG: acyl-CoA dehydrogenase family protein [Acidimicrobiia bacterium]|nr:acyl-CoA dehydrogenase family protein [Acidimicrobiia bacterium]
MIPNSAEIRSWLQANTPEVLRDPKHPDRGALAWGGSRRPFHDPDVERWFREVTARGWAVPDWPVEHGGAGLDAAATADVRAELAAVGAGGLLMNFGTLMISPLITKFGTEEQCRLHLPRMAMGNVAWCLGFSEPDRGSDLAGLQCRAVKDGDDYIVTGAKVWNSHTDRADYMELLVRTDPDAPKHKGISVLMVDLRSPGISISPIELISGRSEFCYTTFDEVRVPVDNRLGEENEGWRLVQVGLRHEREAVVAMAMTDQGFTGRKRRSLIELAQTAGPDAVPADVMADIARLEIENLAFAATKRRARQAAESGQDCVHPSVLKYVGAQLTQRRRDLEMGLRGAGGVGWEGEGYDEEELRSTREWLRAFGLSIEGGTSEIQLNIIAKRVLALPTN